MQKITQIKLRNILKHYTVPFKIQVHKNQGKTEEYHRLSGDQGIKTTQSMWNSGLDCEEKTISKKTNTIQINSLI